MEYVAVHSPILGMKCAVFAMSGRGPRGGNRNLLVEEAVRDILERVNLGLHPAAIEIHACFADVGPRSFMASDGDILMDSIERTSQNSPAFPAESVSIVARTSSSVSA